MARKLLKRWSPDPHRVRTMPALRFLGTLLHDPNLFHLNRHSVSVAVAVGLFVAFLPIPGQMPIAAVLALIFRCNLPISVTLVWITNPLTMPPIFFMTYELGRWILQTPPTAFTLDLSWELFTDELQRIWKPLLTGSLICGIIFSAAGYLAMQGFWYWHVMHNWEKRKKKMAEDKRREM